MPNELAGQIAVVTGGSGAIGGAIIRALAAAGATAYSLDRTPPADESIPWLSCDVSQEACIGSSLDAIDEKHKRLDIVVHAAGISRDAVVWKLTLEDWDTVQAVNLRAAFLLVHHAVPLMRRGKSGRIVLIGSINGSRGKFGTAAYSASKAGLIGLCKTVAREVGRFGVLVNVVEPGWVRTPLTEKVPKEIRDAALAESLVGSFLDPEDIANAVLYLCGPGGRRVTGQILRVDGGQFLGPQ